MNNISDYIVVGGGSGGCAVAGRLTEDPDLSVTVLEAGGGGDSLVVNTPAGVVAMLPGKLNNWAFETVPQPGLNGRRGYQPRGKMLGALPV
jgi:choline dehydrogenase-like flavoprotein